MQSPQTLLEYVKSALSAGEGEPQIRAALAQASWTETEANTALNAWVCLDDGQVVPRAQRSRSALDALFYAILFVCFGAIVGNALTMIYGLINFYLPEPNETFRGWRLNYLRWSMAAMVIILPVFMWLNARDNRISAEDPAHRHGAIRRWLSALAIFCAVCSLIGDGISVTYAFLDGDATPRFLLKSGVVAVLSLITLYYFREGRRAAPKAGFEPASWSMILVAVLALAMSLWNVGGPMQGSAEKRDDWRMSDLNRLARDLRDCPAYSAKPHKEAFDPTECAKNKQALTGFASEITLERLSDTPARLCTVLEHPDRRYLGSNVERDENQVCITIRS